MLKCSKHSSFDVTEITFVFEIETKLFLHKRQVFEIKCQAKKKGSYLLEKKDERIELHETLKLPLS